MSVSHRKLFSLRATILYLVFAVAWILLSDQVLNHFADKQSITQFSTYKGLLFVAVTALILWTALQNVPNDGTTLLPQPSLTDSRKAGSPVSAVAWGLGLPMLAGLAQYSFWDTIQPMAWLLLYPAVFLAAWLAGWWAGVLATLTATLIGWYAFVSPTLSWTLKGPGAAVSIGLFFGMGLLFSLTLEWQREVQQRSGNNLFEALVEQSLVGIYIIQDGVFRYVNPAFAHIMGYDSPEQIINQVPAIALVMPEHRDQVQRQLDRRTEDPNRPLRYALRGRRRDGSAVDLDVHGRGLLTAGSPAVIGLAIDVTERRQTEAALRRSERLLRSVVEGTTDVVFVKDRQGRYLMANNAASKMMARAVSDILGRTDIDLFPPATATTMMARDQAIMQSGATVTEEVAVQTWDGTYREFLSTKGPMLDDGGAVVGMFGLARDIGELLQARRALETQQERLETMVQQRTAELVAARQEAEHLARVKSEFLANMSHEIRTPLNGVLGLAQIGHQSPTADAPALFGQILQSGRVLLGVVNDILDLSKIEAGKLQIESLPVDLRELFSRALTLIKDSAQAKHLALKVQISPALPDSIQTDPLRLEQILLNLLTNAVKFTEAGHIQIEALAQGQQLVVSIADTGIGMNEAQLKHLFEPFVQADNSTTRRYGGTGLGLTITKRLVEMLGGRIRVSSAPGQGTRFDITLPLMAARSSTQTAQSHPSPPSDQWPLSPLSPQLSPPPVPPQPLTAQPQRRLTGLRVLAVEDNRVNQIVLEEFLRSEGADVTLVASGPAAIDCVRHAAPFDAVLMDVQMPQMDGHETTRHIHALAPELPVIGQTAHAMAQERAHCLESGMVDMVTKPLEHETLVQTLLRHTAHRQPAQPPADEMFPVGATPKHTTTSVKHPTVPHP